MKTWITLFFFCSALLNNSYTSNVEQISMRFMTSNCHLTVRYSGHTFSPHFQMKTSFVFAFNFFAFRQATSNDLYSETRYSKTKKQQQKRKTAYSMFMHIYGRLNISEEMRAPKHITLMLPAHLQMDSFYKKQNRNDRNHCMLICSYTVKGKLWICVKIEIKRSQWNCKLN